MRRREAAVLITCAVDAQLQPPSAYRCAPLVNTVAAAARCFCRCHTCLLPCPAAGILYDFFPTALRAALPPGADPARGLSQESARSVAGAALAVATLMNAPPGFLEFLLCVPWAELGPLYLRPESEEGGGEPVVPQVRGRCRGCLASLPCTATEALQLACCACMLRLPSAAGAARHAACVLFRCCSWRQARGSGQLW